MNRRLMLKSLAASGIGTAVFHRAVVAMQESQDEELTAKAIQQAEWVSDIELSDEERNEIVDTVKRHRLTTKSLRKLEYDGLVSPALHFRTLGAQQADVSIRRGLGPIESAVGVLPESDEAIAFLSVTELSGFVRTRQLSSVRLTKIYLQRLKKFGPMLRSVVNLTEELALKQAAKADQEIAAGKYRGPLHGIPWGAKDLISVPGYPTTWGIPHYKDRQLDVKATVVERLEEAGAVLVAKLSLGALAMGDKWFGGMTRNPWNPKQGSSGSSAGSASSVIAGLVGFALGSETLGSILSPCTRCGASGLRPTFGRVSRYGCMPLSWSMDKIGPICRSVEDCALVFAAIHGQDGKDFTAGDYDFQWPSSDQVAGMRIGYAKGRKPIEEREDLKILKELGCVLVEKKLPRDIPLRGLTSIIDVEGAAMFDQLLRDGHTEGWNEWGRIFRAAEFVSGVDYIRCQRARTKLMHLFESFMSDVDAIVNMRDLVHTNLTGHPSVVMPSGYREREGVTSPQAAVLTGHLHQDGRLLALANAYQGQLDAHLKHPPMDKWLVKFKAGTIDKKPEESEKEDGEAKGEKEKGKKSAG